MATLKQAQTRLAVQTQGAGFTDITDKVRRWLDQTGVDDGLLTAFIRHTSASLVIQENADRDVQHDLVDALDRMAPQGAGYRHAMEGPDDMPAHIKTMLTSTSLAIPVLNGKMALGTWQGLYVVEHRSAAHRREVALHYAGSLSRRD